MSIMCYNSVAGRPGLFNRVETSWFGGFRRASRSKAVGIGPQTNTVVNSNEERLSYG